MSYRERAPNIVGPLRIVAMRGWWHVIDDGNGRRVLKPRFKEYAYAERWVARQVPGRKPRH